MELLSLNQRSKKMEMATRKFFLRFVAKIWHKFVKILYCLRRGPGEGKFGVFIVGDYNYKNICSN
jgi:hypothetical protein